MKKEQPTREELLDILGDTIALLACIKPMMAHHDAYPGPYGWDYWLNRLETKINGIQAPYPTDRG